MSGQKNKTSENIWLPNRSKVHTDSPTIWKYSFYGIISVIGLVLIYLSFSTGPNADDNWQNHYADNIIQFYTTLGEDTTALHHDHGPIKYYGGLYELLSASVNAVLGFSKDQHAYHVTRHLIISIFGFLGILAISFMARWFNGWKAACVVGILFLASPVYLGHSAINPKDIPFAAGVAIALFYMWRWIAAWPDLKWKDSIYLGIAIGIALAVRIGGLVLFGYLGLSMIGLLITHEGARNFNSLKKMAIHGIAIFFVAYVLMVLFWPYALQDPIQNPITSFNKFDDLTIAINVLFNGESMMSDATPRSYLPMWIYISTPIVVILGFLIGLIFSKNLVRDYGLFAFLFILFTALFPIAYIVYKNSVIHDAWRHTTFAYMPMVLFASLGYVQLQKFIRKRLDYRKSLFITGGILVLLSLNPIFHTITNPSYSYVYFNELNSSNSQVTGQYETDYWGLTSHTAIQWMRDQGILKDGMEQISIGTNMFYPMSMGIRNYGYYNDEVDLKYVRYSQRFDKNWDYAVFPARFIPPGELRSGAFPGSYAIKTFYVGDNPIGVILKKDKNSLITEAIRNINSGNATAAIDDLRKELDRHPDNTEAYKYLGQTLLNSSQVQSIPALMKQYREYDPNSATSYLYEGLAYMNMNQGSKALQALNAALDLDPNNSYVHFYKGNIYAANGNNIEAIESYNRSIELNPRFRQAYLEAAKLYQKTGDTRRASQYRNAGNRLQ